LAPGQHDPGSFATDWLTLKGMLEAGGRDPTTFPSTMATTWLFVTDDETEARAVYERLSQVVRRPVEDLVGRLPVGSTAACLDLFGRYRDVGLQRVLVWPMRDEVEQLERVAAEIIPHL
jgi:alkanesulfonate monooxygenase SsuD/methylene tetrahydromethanopterin reductase-like flavin-dependent oxidoreductase (luciferase family)